jgi:hypothetical protein
MTLLDDLYRAKRKIEEATPYRPAVYGVRVAPDTLESLKRPAPSWMAETVEERYARAAVWGIPCIVDASLPPGTWEAADDAETWRRWQEAKP